MAPRTPLDADTILKRARPLTGQQSYEIQPYNHLVRLPIGLDAHVCEESVQNLNQLLADTITLRDMYKKHHWQVAGHTFYQRIQLLGGVSLAMAADVADTTLVPRPPRGREAPPVQISRLLHAHEIILREARAMARIAGDKGDDGTNDLLVSQVVRTNELEVWFLAEHVVPAPLVQAEPPSSDA